MQYLDQLIATGHKMQVRGLAERTVPHFYETDDAQKLLAAVNGDRRTVIEDG